MSRRSSAIEWRTHSRLIARSSSGSNRRARRERGGRPGRRLCGLRRLLARSVAGGLGAIATARHVAPAPLARARLVVEHPAAEIVGADAQPLRVAGSQLLDERLGHACERIVDRVADVAVADADPVRTGNQLRGRTSAEGAVHPVERAGLRGTALRDGVGNFSERRSHGKDAVEVLLGRFERLSMDQPALGKPLHGQLGGRKVLVGRPVVRVVLERVDEVERVVELDHVIVAGRTQFEMERCHDDNHYRRLDRLRARGYIDNHTERSKWLLGTKPEVPHGSPVRAPRRTCRSDRRRLHDDRLERDTPRPLRARIALGLPSSTCPNDTWSPR